jgi:cell division protein FtsZ
VQSAADQNANIIFGAVVDDSIGDNVRVTVIATGFDRRGEERPAARIAASPRQPNTGTRPEPTRAGQRQGGPEFEVPRDVLEIPSFLRED